MGESISRIPKWNSKYRDVSNYFSELGFTKLFSEHLTKLAHLYCDNPTATKLLSNVANGNIEIVDIETFLAPKWALADDIGYYLYVYKKIRDMKEFVEEAIILIKRKEQSGSTHIDLSSILFFFAELKNKKKTKRTELHYLLGLIAASTFYPAGTYEKSPYYLRIFQQADAKKVAEKLGLKDVKGYTILAGVFLKKLMEMRESVIKCGTINLTQCILMSGDCRKNQENRLGFALCETEAKMRNHLKDIEDLSEETPELIQALEEIKDKHEFYYMDVRPLIRYMKDIKNEQTIHTIDRVSYKLYSNFQKYFFIPPKVMQEYGIEAEYMEEQGLLDTFANNLAAVKISCSKFKSPEALTDCILTAGELLMMSARQLHKSYNRTKTPDSRLIINLTNVDDIRLVFIENMKKLEALLSSKYNKKFCITISYTENAIRNKGGLTAPEYIRVISDIHADVNADRGYDFDFGKDYVINCGDTAGDALHERDWIRTYIKRGVSIPGNHLGYESAFPNLNGEQNIPESQSTIHWTNAKNSQTKYLLNHFTSKHLKYLSNGILETDFAFIIGTQLYTDFALFGEDNRAACMMEGQRGLNDFKYCYQFVRDDMEVRKFTAEDHCDLFYVCRGYIRNSIERLRKAGTAKSKPIIVMTHHAPTPYSIAPEYKNDPLSASFASDMREFIDEYPEIRLWTHGHVHSSFDYIYKECRVVAEPFGYYWENGNEWKSPEELKNYGKRIPIAQLTSKTSWRKLLAEEIKAGEVKVYDE